MRNHRSRLVVLALAVGTFTSGVVGCANGVTDESPAEPPEAEPGDGGALRTDASEASAAPDASPARDATPPADAGDAAAPQAIANDLAVYLGEVVQLDGSASAAAATFAWALESVPAGSALVTGDLQNAGSLVATFKPDRAGDYTLTLTVTGPGGSSTKPVAVHVVEASVFYTNLLLDADGGTTVGFNAASASGANAHSVVCPSATGQNGMYVEIALGRALYSSDVWEAPPGLDARLAYTVLSADTDGGTVSQLWAATSATSCDAPPRKIGQYTAVSPGGGQYGLKMSSDGSRIAYLLMDESTAKVRAVGFDGSNPHEVAPFLADADAGTGLSALEQPPLRWNGTQIAWANLGLGDGTRFQIVSAADQEGASPSVLMRCSGKLRNFDFLPNGDVVGSFQPAADGGLASAFDLVVLHPNAVTKECEIVRNLTTLSAGSIVYSATLSASGTRVAYTFSDSTVDAGAALDSARLAIVPVDGSSAPTLVSGVPFGAGLEPLFGLNHLAPRWVAGGSALTLQIIGDPNDAGDINPAVAVVSASGDDIHAVATSDIAAGRLVGAVGGCGIARGPGSVLLGFGGLAIFVGLVARRRRAR